VESLEELSKKSKQFREWYYDGEPPLNPVAEPVKEVFQLINAVLFGHIYQRPALDVKTRSLCTIAALTVQNRYLQLPGHITGALNAGATKQQIVELIAQMLFYGGYPATVNALKAAQETFAEYDKRHGRK
jgi:alkylhydroperoxidase/carboxymuconolactone decarboxylase family protein YurZ